MVRCWIDDLDDLAGLDLQALREDRRAAAGSDAPSPRSRVGWLQALKNRLTEPQPPRGHGRDPSLRDARCRSRSHLV